MACGKVVQDHNRTTTLSKSFHDVAANVSRASGYEDLIHSIASR